MTEKAQDQKKVIKPSKWASEQMWRKAFSCDTANKVDRARASLAGLYFYPSGTISNNPDFDGEEANHRYALHQIIDELNRNDLRAVFELCRLMVLFPEGAEEIAQIQEKRDKDFWDWLYKTYPTKKSRNNIKTDIYAEYLGSKLTQPNTEPNP